MEHKSCGCNKGHEYDIHNDEVIAEIIEKECKKNPELKKIREKARLLECSEPMFINGEKNPLYKGEHKYIDYASLRKNR